MVVRHDIFTVTPLPRETDFPPHLRRSLPEITPPETATDNHLNPSTHEIHINPESKPLLKPFQARHPQP